MAKIKVGLLGSGRIAKKHLESIEKNEQFELTAVCDTRAEALEGFAPEVKTFSSYEEFLAADIDLVSICTPSGGHAEQSIQALQADKFVICEKPMAIKTSDALEMIKASQASKGELFIVKQNRFNDTILKVTEALKNNALGKLYYINCNVFWTRPQDYYNQAPWRGTWANDGGAFMNQAIHYFDLVQLFGGAVESVNSITATLARDIEAEDTGSAQLRFSSGAIGSVNVTMLTYPKNLEGSITILGEKGTIKVAGVALNEISNWDVEGLEKPDLSGYETESVYGFGHETFYHEVSKWMKGDAGAITGNDGIKALQIIESCYASARNNGQTVSLSPLV